MSNLIELKSFIRDNFFILVLTGTIFLVVFFSLSTLTTKPRLWTDEAVTIEISNSFSRFGVLDIQTGPGQFSGFPYLLQSTGYPLTLLLATVFKVFGFGFTAVRLVMLLIMVLALLSVFFFGQALFGRREAILAVLLISTFASFYGTGRTAVGEILGLIFLNASLYFLVVKENYYLNGIFLGLSIVTKPSVFLLALPAMMAAVFFEKDGVIKKIARIGVGVVPAIIAWFFFVIGNPFSQKIWLDILKFYNNPYGSVSVFNNIMNNLFGFFNSTTLIYFGILFLIVCVARYWLNNSIVKTFYSFVILYGTLAFIYYLRSPGWLRYVLVAEILILFILPNALTVLIQKIKEYYRDLKTTKEQTVLYIVLLLISIQLIHLLTGAKIYSSDSAIKSAEFINEKFEKESIGLLNLGVLSALLQTEDKYQTYDLMGIPAVGDRFLLAGARPDIVMYSLDNKPQDPEEEILKSSYVFFMNVNGIEVFRLRPRM